MLTPPPSCALQLSDHLDSQPTEVDMIKVGVTLA